MYVWLASEKGNLWDLWALDWVQKKAECLRFCTGRSVTLTGQRPVSFDIEYEFSSRNPYNFLQVTYYKVSSIKGLVGDPYMFFTNLHISTILFLLISWKSSKRQRQPLTRSSLQTPVTWRWGIILRSTDGWREWLKRISRTARLAMRNTGWEYWEGR